MMTGVGGIPIFYHFLCLFDMSIAAPNHGYFCTTQVATNVLGFNH
jgi:hypothetical protein